MAAIYAREAREGVATFDTADPPLSRWTDRLGSTEPGDHFLVAELDGAVAGFAYSAPYRPKPGYRQTRETTVYVAQGSQGRGLGRGLYDELLDRVRLDGVHTVLAGVALPNPASVRLHESVGFAHLGTMHEVGRKLGRWIDVAWYQRLL